MFKGIFSREQQPFVTLEFLRGSEHVSIGSRIKDNKEFETKGNNTYTIKKSEILIGRAEPDIYIENDSISRHHLRIFLEENGVWTLIDDDSSHGSRIDENPLDRGIKYPLEKGKTIMLAEVCSFRVIDMSSHEAQPEIDWENIPYVSIVVPNRSVTISPRHQKWVKNMGTSGFIGRKTVEFRFLGDRNQLFSIGRDPNDSLKVSDRFDFPRTAILFERTQQTGVGFAWNFSYPNSAAFIERNDRRFEPQFGIKNNALKGVLVSSENNKSLKIEVRFYVPRGQ